MKKLAIALTVLMSLSLGATKSDGLEPFDPIVHCPMVDKMIIEEKDLGLRLIERAAKCGKPSEFRCSAMYILSGMHMHLFKKLTQLKSDECLTI